MREKIRPVLFGTSHAAVLVQCDVTTLRDLDRRGLLHPARTSTGRRMYTMRDIELAAQLIDRNRQ